MPQRAASVQVNNNNNKTAIKFTKPGSSSLIIGHDDDLRPVSTLSESGYEHIPSEIWTLILSFAATSSKAQLHHFSQVCSEWKRICDSNFFWRPIYSQEIHWFLRKYILLGTVELHSGIPAFPLREQRMHQVQQRARILIGLKIEPDRDATERGPRIATTNNAGIDNEIAQQQQQQQQLDPEREGAFKRETMFLYQLLHERREYANKMRSKKEAIFRMHECEGLYWAFATTGACIGLVFAIFGLMSAISLGNDSSNTNRSRFSSHQQQQLPLGFIFNSCYVSLGIYSTYYLYSWVRRYLCYRYTAQQSSSSRSRFRSDTLMSFSGAINVALILMFLALLQRQLRSLLLGTLPRTPPPPPPPPLPSSSLPSPLPWHMVFAPLYLAPIQFAAFALRTAWAYQLQLLQYFPINRTTIRLYQHIRLYRVSTNGMIAALFLGVMGYLLAVVLLVGLRLSSSPPSPSPSSSPLQAALSSTSAYSYSKRSPSSPSVLSLSRLGLSTATLLFVMSPIFATQILVLWRLCSKIWHHIRSWLQLEVAFAHGTTVTNAIRILKSLCGLGAILSLFGFEVQFILALRPNASTEQRMVVLPSALMCLVMAILCGNGLLWIRFRGDFYHFIYKPLFVVTSRQQPAAPATATLSAPTPPVRPASVVGPAQPMPARRVGGRSM